MKTAFLSLTSSLFRISQTRNAEIIWDYFSTDGVTEVSGPLASDGIPSVLTSDGIFRLISIHTVLVDGEPTLGWSFGGSPPFDRMPWGRFVRDADEGVESQVQQTYAAIGTYDTMFGNSVQLGVPAWEQSFVQDNLDSEFCSLFIPNEMFFVPNLSEPLIVSEP